MWIYRKNKTLREVNTGIDAVPEFRALSDTRLMYIYYVYCWNSPYFKTRLKDKKYMAAKDANLSWEKERDRPAKSTRDVINLKNKTMNEAILKFNMLQRSSDLDRALLEALQAQINEIVNIVSIPSKDAVELKKKVDLSKQVKDLARQRREIADVIGIRDESYAAEEEEITRELSTLDEFNEKAQ